jgi:2-polyprenyl-6-methoxyphenol hydroxylase-like FAD-dependent oxidoreductase
VTTPVVIAGAGPVGLSLALSLAKAGVRSVVLEKKQQLDTHSRATLIVPRSLEFFHDLGVLDAFLAEGQRNDAIRILRASDRSSMLTFDFRNFSSETPTPFALALSQDRTEHILLDAVMASGLVDVAFDTPLDRFEQQEGGVTVHAADGRVLEAQVLVGADGAHSKVREQLGWKLEGKTYSTRAVLADVRVAPEADTDAGWLADPKAESFTIAIRFASGVWRIIEAAVSDELADVDLPDHARVLAEGVFGPGAWRETLWTAAYRKHERRAPRYVDGRVALAGDAAHLNSPAGGQGMNAGLADAELLARELATGLADSDFLAARLARYQAKRTRAFDEEIRGLTDGLEMMETLPAWARHIAFSAVGLARAVGIEKLVARKLSMLPDGDRD